MYTHELIEYINKRNGKLDKADVLIVTDTTMNPQLNHITYNPWDNSYDMWDKMGTHIHFEVQE